MALKSRYLLAAIVQTVLLGQLSPLLHAAETTSDYVTRKEYDELKAEMLALKHELESMKKARRAVVEEPPVKPPLATGVAGATGTWRVNVLPCPGVLLTVMVAPMACAILVANANPSPVP